MFIYHLGNIFCDWSRLFFFFRGREQGWRSGESTRLPPMWPAGFKSRRRRRMWLSLLLVLSLAPRGFSPGTPVFSSAQKPTLPNSNSIWNALTRLNEFIWTLLCFVGKKKQFTWFFFVCPLGIDLSDSSSLHWKLFKESKYSGKIPENKMPLSS